MPYIYIKSLWFAFHIHFTQCLLAFDNSHFISYSQKVGHRLYCLDLIGDLQWCSFLLSALFSRPTQWYWNIVLVLTLAKLLEAPALFSVQQWMDMLHRRDLITPLFCHPFEFLLSYFLICSKTSSFIRLIVTAGTVAVFNPTLAWHACLVPFLPEELLTWSFMKLWTQGNSHAMR